MRKTARQRGLSHSGLADQALPKEEKVFSFWKDVWDSLEADFTPVQKFAFD